MKSLKMAKRKPKSRGYQLVPIEPTWKMIHALAGEPLILAASDERALYERYAAMLKAAPTR